ncbi:MAG: alcohol dehydrogenase, partial [Candidatus Lindowbacteria bacterium]|nr:alcohol dehydrogenase [Candidatus Lindowbacteria bacterium]
MKALSIEKNAVNYRADLPFETSPNEVVIQPLLVGVCRTDIELAAGYM